MGYKALYRKWRPTIFDDVIGQAHITDTLKNQIKENKVAHAYLFTGTRGTGKTSTAKIFSRAVNCLNSKDGNPCNECDICKNILNDTVLDIIEIDAASNTGVDNIRSVIEQVQYAPTVGKYKVYIIDEVHMLSGGAFNALLKTLEEPPAHVIFILATTETHKVPATILSRCQRIDFKTITVEDISSRILYILDKEKIEAEREAIDYISYLGQGSMRDSLSILEQCLSFSNGKLTYDVTVNILGNIDDKIFYELAGLICEGNSKSVVEKFEKLINSGKNLDNFALGFSDVLRKIAVSKISDGQIKTTFNDEKNKLIKSIADSFTKEKLFACIDLLAELTINLKVSFMQQTLIEIALVRMCNLNFANDYSSLVKRIEFLEEKISVLENGSCVVKNNQKREEIKNYEKKDVVKTEKNSDEMLSVTEKPKNTKNAEVINEPESSTGTENSGFEWKKIVDKAFEIGGLQLYSAIYSTKAILNGDTVVVVCDDQAKKQIIQNSKNDILNIVKEIYGENMKLVFDDVHGLESDNGSTLFSNLNDLSNKFPNNVDVN